LRDLPFLASIVAWLLARVTSLKVLLVSVAVGLAAVKQLMAIETIVVVRPAKRGTMQKWRLKVWQDQQ
jgi:uncharacterized membrane protein